MSIEKLVTSANEESLAGIAPLTIIMYAFDYKYCYVKRANSQLLSYLIINLHMQTLSLDINYIPNYEHA